MSYCLNPDCQNPQNPVQAKFCQTCGSNLLLKDRYRVLLPIGEGGFGKTYVAVDEHRLQTRCVVKQFLPQAKGTGTLKQAALEQAIRLFNQEAVRLDELGEHPQIPRLLAYFEQENRLYLVQQFIEGQNLFQELHLQGAFSEQKIRELLEDLLPVLKFVHDRNVIHRDIKPGNIVRCQNSKQLILIDFGVAKQLSAGNAAKVGTRIGTEGYAPIEQWRGGKAYPASDLYSLGATCIHLLTRVKPDSLFDPIAGRWLWREHLSSRGVKLSEKLEKILEKLLKDAVVERYQSAEEVLNDLHEQKTSIPIVPSVKSSKGKLSSSTLKPAICSWQTAHTLVGHSDRVRTIAISPDLKTLVSGSSDKTIKVWDLEVAALLYTLTGHTGPVHTVIIHPVKQILISGSSDKTIKLWHLNHGKLLYTFTEHTNWINGLAIGAKGQLLASASDDKTIKIWDLKTGMLMKTLTGHSYPVNTVAISPDAQTLVSGSSDRAIKFWNLETGEVFQTLTRHSSRINSVAISPDGEMLVSGSDDGTIKIWEMKTGQLLHTLADHTDSISSIAISPDGKTLISGSHDTTIKLWELKTGKLLSTLAGHSWWVNAVAISPDGQTIASGSADKIIQLWRLTA